ncbi:site-specific DNA-methyltransferase, partial [Helicobacter mehlei]
MQENDLLEDIKTQFGTILAVRPLAISHDKELLQFLLETSKFKEEYQSRFFEEVGRSLVFKKEAFLEFLDLKLLNASFTAFSNKIGLGYPNKRFLKNTDQVVLNFPFKDGVLKGGQSKDEDKSTELFFNNVLAKSEIDVLFSPKALKNFSMVGASDVSLEDTLKGNPNLLIKGNSLIALHTLKKRKDIYGKVKLIYIDPPYNTGNDSFGYNDRFNHSTWLTFMKNRLEIAKEFLREDGVIFIQCDDNEQAYLKVLCDEIFGRENFVGNMIWLKGNAQNDAHALQKNHEYILCYAKSIESRPIRKIAREEKVKAFKDEKTGKFYYEGAGLTTGGAGGTLNARPNLGFSIYYNPITKDFFAKDDYDKELAKISNKEVEVYKNDTNLLKEGYEIIRPPKKGAGLGRWTWALDTFNANKQDICIRENSNEKGEKYIVVKKEWLDPKEVKQEREKGYYALIPKENPPKSFIDFVSSATGTTEVTTLFSKKVFNNPKPESLLKRLIEIATQEGDLVMDFFAGSGTTLAVAHKMKRRWVGVEQMDYIESVTKKRLEKVIEGEQGGVSKALEWGGGGGGGVGGGGGRGGGARGFTGPAAGGGGVHG